jgi:two-component system response regulator MprA
MPFDAVTANVLVVDDDRGALEALGEFLDEEGFDVQLAGNGLEALEVLDAHQPDLIITDLAMPRLDGVGLIRKIRARRLDVPVIVVTARLDASVAQEIENLRVSAFLHKPLDLPELLDRIHAAL